MINRTFVFIALGVATAAPLAAQARERTPQRRVWINGQEVSPLDVVTLRRARLGVVLDMQAIENDSVGATISSVTPGGPAAKAGIRSGDIITRLNGQRLVRVERDRDEDDDQSLAALRLIELMAKLEPGDTVALEYRRDRETRTANIVTTQEATLSMRDFGDGTFNFVVPRSPEFRRMIEIPKVAGEPGFGRFSMAFGGPFAELELAAINPDLGTYFGTSEGVLVIDAPEKNGFGLKGGDVILSIDGRAARGPSSLLRILRSYEPGDAVKLEIMRNKSRQTVTSKIERDDEE